MRVERRAQIIAAFARVLATHGFAGATIASIAVEADVAPGLVHHHFRDKQELLDALFTELVARFRHRVAAFEGGNDSLEAYVLAALALDANADTTAARCWVGVLAEGVRTPALFQRMRRFIGTEIATIERRSGHRLPHESACAVLAYIIGALVLGAFAPRTTAGFAAKGAQRLLAGLGYCDTMGAL